MTEQDERHGLGGGSGYMRDRMCAANRKMEQKAKELGKVPELSAEAKTGTRIATWLAWKRAARDLSEPVLDIEEMEVAEQLYEQCAKSEAEFLGDRQGQVMVEKRFYIYQGINPIRTSRPDYVVAATDRDGLDLFINDDKSGWNRISRDDPEAFAQLEEYAVSVSLMMTRGIKRVMAQYNTRFGIVAREFDGVQLRTFYTELMETVKASRMENAPTRPGWYCKFCPGRLVCPAATMELEVLEKRAAEPLPEGTEGETFLATVKRAKALAEQIIKHYYARLEKEPGCLGNWYIGKGDSCREITNIPLAYQLLVQEGHITHEEWLEGCDGKVTKLEKSYCNKAGKRAKEAKQDFNALLANAITMKHEKGSLERRLI